MAAISVVNLALLRPGDHVLLPDAVYAPARSAAEGFLSTLGVTSPFYDPLAGATIFELFQPTTRLVWVDSRASFTMVVQDLPATPRPAQSSVALVDRTRRFKGKCVSGRLNPMVHRNSKKKRYHVIY